MKELHTNLETRKNKEEFLEKTLENNGSDSDSEVDDSDDEMVMKFILPKNGSGGKNGGGVSENRYIGLTLAQSKKIGKLKADVTRLEDRVRYLQLDLNTAIVKTEEANELVEKYKSALKARNFMIREHQSTFYKHSLLRIYQFFVYLFTIVTHYNLATNNEFIYIVDLSQFVMITMSMFYFIPDVKYVFNNTIPMKINTKVE